MGPSATTTMMIKMMMMVVALVAAGPAALGLNRCAGPEKWPAELTFSARLLQLNNLLAAPAPRATKACLPEPNHNHT
jgi:hypothetical protein